VRHPVEPAVLSEIEQTARNAASYIRIRQHFLGNSLGIFGSVTVTDAEGLWKCFIELANRHDADGIQELLADDMTYFSPFMGPGQRDKMGMRSFQAGLYTAFPDLTYHVERVLSQGGVVMAECLVTGTHTGDLFGIPASNRNASVPVVFVLDIVEGKSANCHRTSTRLR